MFQTSKSVLRKTFPNTKFGAAKFAAPFAVCLLGLSVLSTSGCSFQPRDAYNKNYNLANYLSRVEVAPIENRVGQIMRSEIKHELNPSGQYKTPAFNLVVTYDTSSSNRGTRIDDSAIQVDVWVKASFTLNRIGSETAKGGSLLVGTSEAVSRKNNTEDLYGSYASEEAAVQRSARLVAEDIARQVRLFFRYPNRYPQLMGETQKPQPEKRSERPSRKNYGPQ